MYGYHNIPTQPPSSDPQKLKFNKFKLGLVI